MGSDLIVGNVDKANQVVAYLCFRKMITFNHYLYFKDFIFALMTSEELLIALQKEAIEFNKIVATDNGDWVVKGFIDISKNIYTISCDTKIVSKVLELLLIPAFEKFAQKHDLSLLLSPQQNFYPDLTFVCNKTNTKFAVDIKSTVRDGANKIKSMTLGAFTGYFRNRESLKNTHFPYSSYAGHFVIGVVYSQVVENPNEKAIFTIDELDKIQSVIKDFKFFAQPKYKIASASPGSGNTKNIGSISNEEALINGKGIFSSLGEEVYNDYWMYYLTNDMSKTLDLPRPYSNLKTYFEYKKRGIGTLTAYEKEIEGLQEDDTTEISENE